jgi:hypothetical protein
MTQAPEMGNVIAPVRLIAPITGTLPDASPPVWWLFSSLPQGNAAAQILFLKARAGWTEKLEVTGKDGGPVTLAAMREAFAAEIEGTAKPVSKRITDESGSND